MSSDSGEEEGVAALREFTATFELYELYAEKLEERSGEEDGND